jgi:hypothetical protein
MILKIALIVTIAIIVVITGILVFADTKPNTIQVSRSITIQAPAEKIFPLIDDLHHWPGWAFHEGYGSVREHGPHAGKTFRGWPAES